MEDKDIIAEAKQRFQYAEDRWTPIFDAMREDLRFSDPTRLDQWPEKAKRDRENADGGPRPCFVFDQIGQFVRQVVNQARRNKPAMKFIPVDQKTDPELSEILQGLARQFEYESRADVAYIQALEHATRGGFGAMRLITEPAPDAKLPDQQRVRLLRVVDPSTILIDPDFEEPDGSDAEWGFAVELILRKTFEVEYPGKESRSIESDGWFDDEKVRVVDYYRLTVKDGKKVCELFKMSGADILDRSVFPASYVPLFPVLGNESWEDGKRRLSGAVRGARDPQIAYNYERNSSIEAVAIGPKAPWIAAAEAIEGHEDKWARANVGNIAVLPFNALDENGNQITPPQRVAPAGMSEGWMGLEERSKADIQSALGAYQASVGNNPNSQSGRAVMALQDRADVSTYHYVDNLAITIGHLGRVLTQVWPTIYDRAQVLRIIGEDDETDFVNIDPDMPRAFAKLNLPDGEQTFINPSAARFDVRVTTGPAYATRQMESAAELGELINGNPQMMALLGDVWIKSRNVPNGDVIAKRLKAMLPPAVQKAEEDRPNALPPEVEQTLQQAAQEIQQLRQALQEAQQGTQAEMAKLQQAYQTELLKAQTQIEIARENNDTKRDMEELRGMVQLLLQQMQPPPMLSQAVGQDLMNSQ